VIARALEKFRTKKRECIALFSDKGLTGSNSYFFGVLRQKTGIDTAKTKSFKSELRIEREKLLTAWFSSSVFLALYLYYRREISQDYGRIKIGDMSSFPCIDPSKLSSSEKNEILSELDKLGNRSLPTLYDQLQFRTLNDLDLAILRSLKVEEPKSILEELYKEQISELDRTESADQETQP
jgi:hypothetical protein